MDRPAISDQNTWISDDLTHLILQGRFETLNAIGLQILIEVRCPRDEISAPDVACFGARSKAVCSTLPCLVIVASNPQALDFGWWFKNCKMIGCQT